MLGFAGMGVLFGPPSSETAGGPFHGITLSTMPPLLLSALLAALYVDFAPRLVRC